MTEPDRTIAQLFEAGQPRGLARAISQAEAGRGAALMERFSARAGRASTIGLTGPPGVGKSTLCSALVAVARAAGKSVGVVSVDPSSPFTHGAILGDRIRLTEHFTDPGVFIRSMASRGHLGGLAGATGDAVAFMDAFGLDVVIVETVGVGQSEIEIAELADTTLVALQPGSGDSVQLLKAGILEVADIFVVNKADHPMASQLQREIRSMMEMLESADWIPELVATRARENVGIDELWAAIDRHDAYLRRSGALAAKRRGAYAHRVRALVMGALAARVDARIAEVLTAADGPADPYRAAAAVVGRFLERPFQ
ncbi:MAG: methylmalonyl Co-A mutase-associated GTPase MeaB [Vulcanimicrobiaceae bacterium]